jgi:hypothetical protein
MTMKLTRALVTKLPVPTDRPWLAVYDTEVPGLGIRTMKSGKRSAVLRYRFDGVEKLGTIGDVGFWIPPGDRTLKKLRTEARRLREEIRQRRDSFAERQAGLDAPTVNDVIERWREERVPRMRPRSAKEAEGLIRQWIASKLGDRKIASVTHTDTDQPA